MVGTMSREQIGPTSATSYLAAGDALDRDTLTAVTLAAVATTVMFQTIRIFVSYMVFVIDQSNRLELAIVVFGTFLMIGLGGLVIRLTGLPAALLIGMAGLVVPRGIVQFTDSPEARFILGGVAIVAWGWLMIALLGRFRAAAAAGLVLGVGLDLAIRTAFMTVDLPWIPSAARHTVTIILLAIAVAAALLLARRIHLHPPAPRTALSLLAVGPAFALYHVAAGNFGFAQEHGGVGFPGAAVWLTLGALLGIAALVLAGWRGASAMPDRRVLLAIAGFVLAAGLAMIWLDSVVAVASIALAMAGLLALLGSAALGRPQSVDRPGDAWVTVCFTGGLLLQVGLLFLYYTYSGSPVFLGLIALIVVVLAIPFGAPAFEQAEHSRRYLVMGGAGVGVLLVLATVWHLVTFSEPVPGAPAADPMTIMTYNLQNGFDSENRWHLERQAQTIEAQNPDVVVLQEVSRGWLVMTGVDQVLWLSQRLDMPFIFGTNSDDWVWGNVILSRAPILESRTIQYSVTDNLKRGAIEVLIATEAGDVWVYGTHLDNPRDAAEVRFIQGAELVGFWGGEKRPALVLGDLNVDPDDDLIARFADAGFHDTGLVLGPDAFTSSDRRRIDYILATDDLEIEDIHIPLVWTSDHRPVVATLRLGTAN